MSEVFEVRIRPRATQADVDLKVRIIRRLLSENGRVRVSVMFRGREISHPEIGHEVIDKVLAGVDAEIERGPEMIGRFLVVVLRRKDDGSAPVLAPLPDPPSPRTPSVKMRAPEPEPDAAEEYAIEKQNAR